MNNTYKLIELAKKETGIESDYGISKLINVSKGMVSHWRIGRSEASGVNLLKLMKAANISVDEALEMLDKQEEQPQLLKQAGFANIGLLAGMTGVCFGVMTLAKMSDLPYEALTASIIGANFVYYVKYKLIAFH